jgi:cell division protein ZapA (FtsZ GTPase activity inhibitor)
LKEISIKVNIADRNYPLTIKVEEEETVRKAAKLINDKIKELQQQFAVRDKQDLLSMILLETTTALLVQQQQASQNQEAVDLETQEIARLLSHIRI